MSRPSVPPTSGAGAADIDRRTGIVGWFRYALSRAALASFRYPLLTLLGAGLLLGCAALAASRLEVDPDISELLPPSYESVRDIETLKERFGGIGYVAILLEGGDAPARRALGRALAEELERLESVSYVELERPAAYLKHKALWLLEHEDLVELRRRIEVRYHYEIDRMFLDLDDSPPPRVETEDLVDRLRARFSGVARPEGRDGAAAGSDHYEDERTLALFVRPTELATNLEFARRVVADVERVVSDSAVRFQHPEISVQLTGRYKKRVDLQAVLSRDLGRTALLALGLVAAYLAFHFRRPSAVALVLLPLISGLVLTYGLAAWTVGTLNVLTAFLGAILIGIGVDSGIHLLGRVHEQTAGGASLEAAVVAAFRDAGRVSLAAALTTAAAFLCLTLTDFRAFREFGTLTGAGVVLVLASYLLLLPALLRVASRFRFLRPARAGLQLPGTGWLMSRARVVVPVLGALALWLAGIAPRAQFDADLSRLDEADLPSFRLDREVTRLLGHSQTPVVAFPRDEGEARAAAALVRERMRAEGPAATIGEVASLSEILPDDLAKKEPHVAAIRKMLSRGSSASIRSELEETFPELDLVLEAGAPTKAELPPSILRVLAPEQSAGGGPLVLLYPNVSLGDPSAVRRLADQVRHLELPSGSVVRTAGEPMVLADILALIVADGPHILAVGLILVVVLLRITLGSFRLAWLAAAPGVLTVVVTAGALSSLGISFNVLNVIILPILLGIGVDDGAHFVARLEEGEPLGHVWRHTGADVSGAVLTDVFGFGVLALAAHPGLASLGQVALVGLGVNFLLCVVLLPALLALVPVFGTRPAEAPEQRIYLGEEA